MIFVVKGRIKERRWDCSRVICIRRHVRSYINTIYLKSSDNQKSLHLQVAIREQSSQSGWPISDISDICRDVMLITNHATFSEKWHRDYRSDDEQLTFSWSLIHSSLHLNFHQIVQRSDCHAEQCNTWRLDMQHPRAAQMGLIKCNTCIYIYLNFSCCIDFFFI